MPSGEEIRRARQRAGWPQEELARRVGTTLRSVGNWERNITKPTRREAVLRSVLAGYWDADIHGQRSSLHQVSDVELLSEVGRRLTQTEHHRRQETEEVGSDEERSAPMNEADDESAPDDEVTTRRTTRDAPPVWEEDAAAFTGIPGEEIGETHEAPE